MYNLYVKEAVSQYTSIRHDNLNMIHVSVV